MRCIRYCVWAALIMGLAACKAQQSGNETQQPANEAQKVSKKEQPPAKAATPKCPSFSTQLPVQVPDLTRKVFACVEKNALLFSKGPDSAETLSKAVMAKCKVTITQYVDQEAKKAGVRPPYKDAFESWQGHALAIIAEARARRCYG
jgi:hypothetical protein